MVIKNLCACNLQKEQQLIPKISQTDYYMSFWQFLLQRSVLLDWSDSHYEVIWLHVMPCCEFWGKLVLFTRPLRCPLFNTPFPLWLGHNSNFQLLSLLLGLMSSLPLNSLIVGSQSHLPVITLFFTYFLSTLYFSTKRKRPHIQKNCTCITDKCTILPMLHTYREVLLVMEHTCVQAQR